MKAKSLSPDSDHAPAIKQDDTYSNRIKHNLGVQSIPTLDPPEGINAGSLGCNSNDQQVSQFERVVLYDCIL